MQKLSKFILFLFFLFSTVTIYFSYKINIISAGDEGAFPEIRFPCDRTKDTEFHSMRPYQGAPCGDVNKALYCSNEIQFLESFDLTNRCPSSNSSEDYWCEVNMTVAPHDIYVELSESEFPILGNTEQVTNSQGGVEEFNDAQKMNEYISWYLAGVTGKAEYGKPTDEQLINYTGPLNKLLPSMIQEAERANTIKKATEIIKYTEENSNGEMVEKETAEMHDQIVVCGETFKLFGLIDVGKTEPVECYDKDRYRIGDWLGDLSDFNKWFNRSGWNKRTPPFPWDDGTVENPSEKNPPKPFKSQQDYQKAYNEWRGDLCVNIPFIDKNLCVDNPFVPNKWAELYNYIPLGNTTDKIGANYITGDGPTIQGDRNTTELADKSGQFTDFINAALYVPHAQYVKETSELLNKTFQPSGYQNEKVPETTEVAKNADGSLCTAANVRVNEGDNIFPGDTNEMQVLDVTYTISRVKCMTTETPTEQINLIPNFPCKGPIGTRCTTTEFVPKCLADVYITLNTATKTPNADEIFSQTVADSGSTFRKMFPKVQEGAPVECIADIPTVTDVTYDTSQTQGPRITGVKDGTQTVKITNYPNDSASGTTQLTFPHFGSVYEYFLNGIQTALRPKGYGSPIANGNCDPTPLDSCDVNVPDSAVPSKYLGSFKENFIDLADRWSQKCPGPENNMAEECYNWVTSVAQKEGVNPAFALTIWLNESGASNYCEGGETTQDMGVNLSEIYQNLPGQLLKFVELAKQQFCSGMPGFTEPMHGWLSRYQSSAGVCNPSDETASQYYYDVMNTTWNWVSGCTRNGKFGIQWPTDFSCP